MRKLLHADKTDSLLIVCVCGSNLKTIKKYDEYSSSNVLLIIKF